MNGDPVLLYGATGFTGRLVAAELARRDIPTILGGRTEGSLHAVAEPLGLPYRVGGFDDIDLGGASAVLNCAGPFSRSQPPLLDACLRAGIHYLDLAGEYDEHLTASGRGPEAAGRGAMVMPGVGYGIVPSDCLLAHVCSLVSEPVAATIALKTVGGVSRGSAEAVLGRLREPGVKRRGGELVEARAGTDRLGVDFRDGDGPTTVVTNPWRADLAGSVPGVPDLDALMAFPAPVRALMRIPHGSLLRTVASRLPEGPPESKLEAGRSAVWAHAACADGTAAEAVINGPDAYLMTAATAAASAARVVAGDVTHGYATPASAWGADFTLEIPGLVRRDTQTFQAAR